MAIKPLEKLAKAGVAFRLGETQSIKFRETTEIKVTSDFSNDYEASYLMGPGDDKDLLFAHNCKQSMPVNISQTGVPGVVRFRVQDTIYIVHQKAETLPSDLDYKQVSITDYLKLWDQYRLWINS